MPDALHHVLPADPYPFAVVAAYLLSSSAFSMAAGIVMGWALAWRRR